MQAKHLQTVRITDPENKEMKKISVLILLIAATAFSVRAQTAEIKLTFDEPFFDALLAAMFENLEAPSVPLSRSIESESDHNSYALSEVSASRNDLSGPFDAFSGRGYCDEAITLKREVDGVRTAVRFRQGKIYAPIAFSGNYNPPLIGCIEFQGWAEANIVIAYDKNRNVLVGNATVLNVNLSGTGGAGGNLIARMVQSSIDRKINPIEIVSLDKLSFTFPIKNSGSLKMQARGIRSQVNDRSLDVYVNYEFVKGR
jgi:hypothetical protein